VGTYTGTSVSDTLIGRIATADELYGFGGDDFLLGDGGDDWLYGGQGADALFGGTGIDTASYSDSDRGVTVNLATRRGYGGTAEGDTLFDIENLFGSNYYDILTGNDQANTIYAGDGGGWIRGGGGADTLWGSFGIFDDFLDGGTGIDTMRGGRGNDNYYVDSSDDVVVERWNEGTTDRVYTSTTYYLGHDSHVEMLIALPSATDPWLQLYGNNFDNRLIGNDAGNVLSGLGGADTLIGNGGSDLYVITDARASIIEAGGRGDNDRAYCYVSYTLTPGADVEVLATTDDLGINPIDLTGNASGQTVTGNNGNNRINGGDGNDLLWGDSPWGATGQDTFVFNTAPNALSNIDEIADFDVTNDTIELDATIFSSDLTPDNSVAGSQFVIGSAALDAGDRIIYDNATGAVFYDSDGTGPTAAIQFSRLSAGLADPMDPDPLTNFDFFVVA
jgi:Ca2+-binding RTX toxin-like protein